jgi:hypothetical protein
LAAILKYKMAAFKKLNNSINTAFYEFIYPENIGLDTKIKCVCVSHTDLWVNWISLSAILKSYMAAFIKSTNCNNYDINGLFDPEYVGIAKNGRHNSTEKNGNIGIHTQYIITFPKIYSFTNLLKKRRNYITNRTNSMVNHNTSSCQYDFAFLLCILRKHTFPPVLL